MRVLIKGDWILIRAGLRLLEKVPGFAVLLEAGTASADVAFGIETEAGAWREGVRGDYVPEIQGEDVGD